MSACVCGVCVHVLRALCVCSFVCMSVYECMCVSACVCVLVGCCLATKTLNLNNTKSNGWRC